ncbi:transposase [Patescibacteria group bacterium]|nr:transposase [Patescibacteria group bacterium]
MRRKYPFAVGKIYHIYNRGVAKCSICLEERDYWRFLQGLVLFNDTKNSNAILYHLERNQKRLTMNVLKAYIIQEGKKRHRLVRILAYSVMENHYHLIVEEIQEGCITKFMHKLGMGYAKYINAKYERVGSLFQDKFKNILIESEQQLLYLLVYINVLNPAGIIEPNWKEEGIYNLKKVLEFAESYQWSSHLDYLGKRGSLILEKGVLGDLLSTAKEYRELVHAVVIGKKYAQIEHLTLE